MKNKDIKNIIYNSIKTCLSIVFPLVTFPYISRVLQAENVGKLNFSQSIVSYFALLASLGISTYAIRECSKVRDNRKELSEIASELFSIDLYTSIFAILLLMVVMTFYKKIHGYWLLIIIYSVNIISTTFGTDWINTACEEFKFITIRSFIFQILSIVAMFIFVRNKEDYIIYAVISVTSQLLICITNIIYRRRFCDISFILNVNWRKHIVPVFFLFVTVLSQNVFNNCDITMIGLSLGDYFVGLYTTAHKIINIVFLVVASICWVMMPQLSVLFSNKNYNEANVLLYQIIGFTIALGMPIFCGINLLAKELILIVGGNSYLGAVSCLRILSISMLISFFIGIFGNMVLIPSGDDKLYMISCLVAMCINVIANYILIPIFGINGASVATIASEAINLFIVLLLMNKNVKVSNIFKLVVGPFFGCIVICIIYLVFSIYIENLYLRTFTITIFGAIVYFIILIATKNEFALSFIYPILRKLKIIND